MTEQKLIDLPEIRLPRDLAWRVKFIQAVEEHMRHLGVDGHFQAPRFFGYYFCGAHPVVLATVGADRPHGRPSRTRTGPAAGREPGRYRGLVDLVVHQLLYLAWA